MSTKGEQQMVESLDTLIFKLNVKNSLRKLWASTTLCPALQAELKSIAKALAIDFQTLVTALQDNQYFESFWEQIEDHLLSTGHAKIITEPVSKVISSLRQYFSKSFAKPVASSITVNKTAGIQSIAV